MADFKSTIKSGIIWNSIASFARYGLQFAAVMVLARMLVPEDYGLVGILTVFITVADTLVDSGLGGAVIKKANATDIDFSTLTIYNFFVSLVIYLVYYISAPYIADYYQMPELTGLMRLYAVTILVYAMTIAPRAYLTKHLKFKSMALLYSFAGAIALVTAIVLAYKGYGAYSIVWQYLVNAIIYSIGTIIMAKYKFCFSFSWASFKEQFNFGFYTMIALILKNINENIYSNVIGKKASIAQTGYYAQSGKLMNVPVGFLFNMIEGTFFPIMSQIENKALFAEKIVKLNRKTMTIVIILFSIAIPMNREIVYILLGDQWIGAVWTVRMLMIAGLFISLGNIGSNLIKCTGKTYIMFRYELIVFVLSMLALYFASGYGYDAIVLSFLCVTIIKMIMVTVLGCKLIDISFLAFVKPLLPVALYSFAVILICINIDIENIWLSIILKGIVMLPCFGGFLYYQKRKHLI